ETFGDAWREFFHHLFFGEVLAEIDSSGGGCGQPEFAFVFRVAGFESIKQTKALNQAQRDDGEKPGIGNDGDHAAEAEARAFREREALSVTKLLGSYVGHVVE